MKKKTHKELLRVQTMIENDRLNIGRGFNELLVSDLSKLFTDYFDFNGFPELEIIKENGKYKVSAVIHPTRIKAFNISSDKR